VGSTNYSNIQTHVASTAGVETTYVDIAVTSGSVNMDVSVTVPTGSSTSSISNTLSNTYSDAATTSELLGVTITSSPAVTVAYASSLDDDDGVNTGLIVGCAVGGGVALIVIVAVILIMIYKPFGAAKAVHNPV